MASGNWSNGANWSTGNPPLSSNSTALTFSGVFGYTATNDMGVFLMQTLTFDNRGTAGINIAFSNLDPLFIVGANPTLMVSGTGPVSMTGGTFAFPLGLTITTPNSPTAISPLSISGLFSGSNNLIINRPHGGFLGVTTLAASPQGSFTGPVTLTGGPLSLGSATALGPGILNIGTLGGGMNANGDLRAATTLTLSNNVSISAGATLNVVTGSALTLAGHISGQGGLNLGDGFAPTTPALTLSGLNSYTGSTLVNSGTLTLSGDGPNGALLGSAITVGRNGTLVLGSTTTLNADRVAGAVTMQGGSLSLIGNATAGNNLSESIPTVASRGFSTFTVDTQTVAASRLEVTNFQRLDRGTLRVRGDALGSAAFGTAGVANLAITQIDGQPIATRLVGGGGAAGTVIQSILPFAIGASSAIGAGDTFVTADANGLRPLLTGIEYSSQLLPLSYVDPATNYRLTFPSVAMNHPTTVNALLFSGTGSGVYGLTGPSATVTVASGAVLASFDAHTGPLAFGNAEGVIHSITNTLNLGSLTGSNGLTISGTGEVVLTNTSGVSGPFTLNGGTVVPTLSNSLPASVALNGGGLSVRGFESTLTTNLNVGPAGGFLRSQPINASSTGTGSVLTYPGTVSGTGVFSINGSGAGSQNGGGRVVLTANNSGFGGTWQVGGGVLAVDSQVRLGSAPVVLDGGILDVTADTTIANRIVLTNTSGLFGGPNETVFTGRIEGRATGAGLNVGRQVFLENAATYDGPTTIDGLLSLRNTSGRLAGTSGITVRGTLDLDNRDVSAAGRLPAVPLTLAGGHYRFQGGAGVAAESETLGALTLAANTGNRITLRPQSASTSSVRQVLAGGLTRGAGSTLVIESRNQQGFLGGVITTGFGGTSTGVGELAMVSPTGLAPFGFVNGIVPHAFLLQATSSGANNFGEGRLLTAVPGIPEEGSNGFFVRHLLSTDPGVIHNTFAGATAASNILIDDGHPIGGGIISLDYEVPTGLAVNAIEIRNANLKTSTTFTINTGTIAFGQRSNGISRLSFQDPYGIVRSPAGVDLSVFTTNHTDSGGNPFEYSFTTTFAPGSGVLNMTGGFAALNGMYPNVTRLNIHSGRVRATGGDPGVPQFNANLDLYVQGSADFFIADNLLAAPPDNNLPALNRLFGEGDVDFTGPTLTIGGANGNSLFGGRLTASGGGTVIKAGTGELHFTRGDAGPGLIDVTNGTLHFGPGSTSFLAIPSVTGDTIRLRNGSTLTVDGVTSFERNLDVFDSASLTGILGTATTFTTGITLRSGSTLNVTANTGGALRFNGAFAAQGSLALNGGTIILAGTNSHQGGTTLDNNVMVGVASSQAFGNGSVTVAGSAFMLPVAASRVVSNPLTLAGNLTFGPASGAEAMSTGFGLTFTGGVSLGGAAGSRTVSVTGTGNFTFQNLAGPANVGLTKAGGGVLTLTGTADYAGTTLINAGTLHVVGNKTGTAAITVGTATATGAKGVLSGPGSVVGLVTVRAGGVVAPGASAGVLRVNSGIAFESGSTYHWELAANTVANPVTNYDQIDPGFSNTTIQAGARLVPNFIGTATAPDGTTAFWQSSRTWIVIDTQSNATGSPMIVDNTAWQSFGEFTTSLGASGGVFLRWTPVPEPIGMLALAAVAGVAMVRKRERKRPS